MRFAGNCIDGPWRGRKVERSDPWFKIMSARLPALFDPTTDIDPRVTCDELVYVWVYSLGEWAIADGPLNRYPTPPKLWHYPD